jgi:hypothetical protein
MNVSGRRNESTEMKRVLIFGDENEFNLDQNQILDTVLDTLDLASNAPKTAIF